MTTPSETRAGKLQRHDEGADIIQKAKFRAACYQLKNLIDGPGCIRWADEQGFGLKDTKEWVEFYNLVTAMHNGQISVPYLAIHDVRAQELRAMLEDWKAEVRAEHKVDYEDRNHQFLGSREHDIARLEAALAASEPVEAETWTCPNGHTYASWMRYHDSCPACRNTHPAPEQPGNGEALAWSEEDEQRPWGAEVAFLRHLADDPALNDEQSMLLLHCAKRIERTSAVECVPDWVIFALNKADELLELEDYSATDLKAARDYLKERANLTPQPSDPAEGDAAKHDNDAVDLFAAAMKAKLAEARAKGRGGWEDDNECNARELSYMLRAHVDKGDPRDVANFACFLWNRGERITCPPSAVIIDEAMTLAACNAYDRAAELDGEEPREVAQYPWMHAALAAALSTPPTAAVSVDDAMVERAREAYQRTTHKPLKQALLEVLTAALDPQECNACRIFGRDTCADHCDEALDPQVKK